MSLSVRRIVAAALVAAVGALSLSAEASTVKDKVGYTQLANELGPALPNGSAVTASQVEAPEGSNYAPNSGHSEFTGKTFTLKSGTSGNSSHATTVGQYLYGNSTSLAPGITEINNWEVNNWLGSGFLKTGSTGSGAAPEVETQIVQTHAWVGSYNTEAANINALQRFDFTINRDNYVAVVGLDNGSNTSVPELLAHSYNAIVVGRSDGLHSRGGTTFDTAGRVKPDIVAPLNTTSYATPIVGSAGALLWDHAETNASTLGNARNSEAVKAILMAGATKEEFPDWSRTTTRPLDSVYGAGELNIYNSYHILDAGQQPAGPASTVATTGWDFTTVASASGEALYFFDVPQGMYLENLSALLTWNREVTANTPWNSITTNLANFDLELYATDGSFSLLGNALDQSLSTVDNVEHIYYDTLVAGQYAMRVLWSEATANTTEYGFAWRATVVPEPTSVLLLLLAAISALALTGRSSRHCDN